MIRELLVTFSSPHAPTYILRAMGFWIYELCADGKPIEAMCLAMDHRPFKSMRGGARGSKQIPRVFLCPCLLQMNVSFGWERLLSLCHCLVLWTPQLTSKQGIYGEATHSNLGRHVSTTLTWLLRLWIGYESNY
jgi:hypothetical protein